MLNNLFKLHVGVVLWEKAKIEENIVSGSHWLYEERHQFLCVLQILCSRYQLVTEYYDVTDVVRFWSNMFNSELFHCYAFYWNLKSSLFEKMNILNGVGNGVISGCHYKPCASFLMYQHRDLDFMDSKILAFVLKIGRHNE